MLALTIHGFNVKQEAGCENAGYIFCDINIDAGGRIDRADRTAVANL